MSELKIFQQKTLEQLYQNKKNILEKSQNYFSNSSSLTVKIGCELEFFLLEKNSQSPENKELLPDFILELKNQLTKNFSLIYQVEKEQGYSQIEIKSDFTADLSQLCVQLEEVKNFTKTFAQQKNLLASFAAQPFVDDCGSALQFNISLHDENQKNLFEKKDEFFLNSIAALLKFSDKMLILLSPNPEDYLRFDVKLNRDLHKKGKYLAPTNLSFGEDNRTAAIRIPRLEKGKSNTRIEYRIASSNADCYLAISAILLSLLCGIKKEITFEKSGFKAIYGNAFDEQYSLPNFSKDYVSAQEKFFAEENFIRKTLIKFC